MQKTLLDVAQKSMKEYYFQYLTAATVLKNQTIVAWFNGQAIHSATLALDLVHNALIKIAAGADYGIHVANKPLPFLPKNDTTIPDAPDMDSFGYSFAMTIGVLMSVLSASYIGYHIKVSVICFYIRFQVNGNILTPKNISKYGIGKRMQCTISAICQWSKIANILGRINHMGFANQLHHHWHNHHFTAIGST